MSADSAAADTGSDHGNAVRPFAPFEWMIAGRYLRARRRDTFISVIAGFSFAGIMLGVATLIIVMAVMNGFRSELLGKILGINGHMLVQPIDMALTDYDPVAKRLEGVPDVISAIPFVEGQALVSGPSGNTGGLVRGMSETNLRRVPLVADNIKSGTLDGFDAGEGDRNRVPYGSKSGSFARRQHHNHFTQWQRHPHGSDTPGEKLSDHGHLRDWDERV